MLARLLVGWCVSPLCLFVCLDGWLACVTGSVFVCWFACVVWQFFHSLFCLFAWVLAVRPVYLQVLWNLLSGCWLVGEFVGCALVGWLVGGLVAWCFWCYVRFRVGESTGARRPRKRIGQCEEQQAQDLSEF